MAGIRFVYKSASAKLTMMRTEDKGLITSLESTSPGQGHGSELMHRICVYADDLQVALHLKAQVYKAHGLYIMSNRELVAFYERFGFVWQKGLGLPAQMIRQPSQKKQ